MAELGLREWFLLHQHFDWNQLTLPSQRVRILWQAFSQNGRFYRRFCHKAFQQYLPFTADNKNEKALSYTWMAESIFRLGEDDSDRPLQGVPPIFGIDDLCAGYHQDWAAVQKKYSSIATNYWRYEEK